MNLSNIGKPIAVAIAATSLVATYLYFSNVKPVAPPLVDNTLPTATARPTQQDTKILAALPDAPHLPSEGKSSRGPVPALPNPAKQAVREDIQSNPERELILAEENGFGYHMQIDTSAPPPTADNMTAKPTGEYFDQIDQQSILEQAEIDGLLDVRSDWDEPEPSDDNVSLIPEDELALEIDEYEIVSLVEHEGYPLPEVDPDSHPPTETNELHLPDDGYADEIIAEHGEYGYPDFPDR